MSVADVCRQKQKIKKPLKARQQHLEKVTQANNFLNFVDFIKQKQKEALWLVLTKEQETWFHLKSIKILLHSMIKTDPVLRTENGGAQWGLALTGGRTWRTRRWKNSGRKEILTWVNQTKHTKKKKNDTPPTQRGGVAQHTRKGNLTTWTPGQPPQAPGSCKTKEMLTKQTKQSILQKYSSL